MKKLLLAVTVVLSIYGRASADLYWDSNDLTPGAGTTPTGTWGTSTFWSTDPNGGVATAGWTSGETAVFSAGTDATGAYTVTVSGTQTAAGIRIEEGTVTVAGGTANVGTGIVTLNPGATLITDSSLRINLDAGGKYVINGPATLRTTNASAAGSFVDSQATITLNGNLTVDYQVTNVLNIIQTATVISGTGDLIKTGGGVLALASASTYNGDTIVNGGELRMRSAANRLPVATDLIVNSPGILNLNGPQNQTVASLSGTGNVGTGSGTLTIDGSANTTFDGALKNIANAGAGAVTTGNGRLVKNGSGTITFNGLNDINGSVTLNAGGIIVSPSASLSGSIADLNVNGGTLTLNNAAQTIENLASTAAAGTIVLGPGHVLTTDPVASTAYSGTITGPGGLVKANALSGTRRTLTLSGNNSYDGNTVITGGLISVQHANALGSTLGYTEVNATSPLGAEVLFTGAGGSVTTSEPFRIAGAGSSNNGAISVIATATPTLSGPITLIGDSTIAVSSTSAVTLDNPNAITSLANQSLTLRGGSGAGAGGTISGTVNLGTGSLTKLEGGTWRLNAAGGNSYSGGTTISSGTLLVNNTSGSGTGSGAVAVNGGTLGGTGSIDGPVTVADGATVAPGESPGTLTINNTFVLNPASTLAYELNGGDQTVGGGVNDLIAGVTDLTLDGTLNISETVAGSFLAASNGNIWRLITYTGALINNGLQLGTTPALPAGQAFVIDTATLGQVNLAVVPEAGAFAAVGLVGLISAGAVWVKKRRAGRVAA